MTLRLQLLGPARLQTPNGQVVFERKTAAVLAYLALEGPTPKYRLAGWLWPESGESTARNNMRQLLRRLRLSSNNLIQGEERIALNPQVACDACELSSLNLDQVLQLDGQLLDGFDYDDTPELADWLEGVRQEFKELRWRATEAQAEQLEQAERLAEALEWAQRLVKLDPLAEEAHQRLMRLYYRLGNRAAAMAAYERCYNLLKQELGAQPLPSTQALAQQIEQGQTLLGPNPHKALPLGVLRPPQLLARQREWALLLEAAQEGRLVLLSGEAGMGKSRLANDFATAQGQVLHLEARPGDARVPYATATRNLRRYYQHNPLLPAWAMQELSRLLPELGQDAPPKPLVSDLDRLRFFEAATLLAKGALPHLGAVIIEDLHYYDQASLELELYLLNQLLPTPRQPAWLTTFRPNELDSWVVQSLNGLVNSNLAQRVELKPLDLPAMQDLLQQLFPEQSDLAQPLLRYTGGNPWFALETLRQLFQNGQLERGWPGRLPPPEKISQLIVRGFERLSPNAQLLAQAAAVLQSDYTFEQISQVLGQSPPTLLAAYQELEAHHIMQADRFSHDLVQETVRQSTPMAISQWLHRNAAHALEPHGNPARIAWHYLQGQQDLKAAPWLMQAAQQARHNLQLHNAAQWQEQAAHIFGQHQQPAQASQALHALLDTLSNFDNGPKRQEVLQQLLQLAQDPQEKQRVQVAQAVLHLQLGQLEPAAQSALAALHEHSELNQAEPLNLLGIIYRRQGKLHLAEEVLQRALPQSLHDPNLHAAILSNLGLVLQQGNRFEQAALHFEQATALQPDPATRARVLNNLSLCFNATGQSQKALGIAYSALHNLEQAQGATAAQLVTHISIGHYHQLLGEYTLALKQLEQASALSQGYNHWKLEDLYRNFARVYTVLGEWALAQHWIKQAFGQAAGPTAETGLAWLLQARLLRWQNQPAQSAYAQASGQLQSENHGLGLMQAQLEASLLGSALEGCELAQRIAAQAKSEGCGGLQIHANTRIAQHWLALGQPQKALDFSQQAFELTQHYTPDNYIGEVWWVHWQCLLHNQSPHAAKVLRQAQSWISHTAEQQVPLKHRSAFLERNPFNQALLSG